MRTLTFEPLISPTLWIALVAGCHGLTAGQLYRPDGWPCCLYRAEFNQSAYENADI